MIILVTGIDDSGRDEIAEMVLRSYKSMMPASTMIKASESIPDLSAERSLAKLSRSRDNSLAKLEKGVVSALKKGGNIVISAGLSAKTVHGFVPVVTKGFVDTVKPDLIIFMEIHPSRVESYMEHEHVDWAHQRFERQMAGLFSMSAGSPLRVIRLKPANVKGALKDMADALRAAMG